MTAGLDRVRLAHRAIVAATVLGVLGKAKRPSVVVGELGAIAGAEASLETSADVVVIMDEGTVAGADVASALTAAREMLTRDGVIALVVGSPVTSALIDVARRAGTAQAAAPAPPSKRDDAFAEAVSWAAARIGTSPDVRLAPALEPSRLARIVDAAAERDLMLVEADIAIALPGLARVRGMRSPRARALLATLASGASARPLLFVPTARAPKGGLARAKVERLADGWVAAGIAPATEARSDSSGIARAATAVLDDAARAGRGPLAFKELLREARERWSADVRASGGRATPSASDASELAAALYRLAADDRVELWILDPAAPAMTVTPL